MHNKFIDKRRRFINFRDAQVGNILPEHFASSYPKFISLLEKYYEFQDQNNSTELLNHLFASRDINETDITLLTFIEDELLLGEEYFEGFTGGGANRDVELRAAANFSNILFRSKGSKFAIEWFFRSFYGEEVEVLYPKENIFTIGFRDSLIGPDSLRYITDDKLYQTFALLIRIGIPISKWRDVFKLFAHPAGMYLGGEVLIADEIDPNITTPTDIIDQYTTPNYFITTTASVDEGESLTVFANGNNVQNSGTSYVYWYGAHVTTNDSDFGANFADDANRLGLPDSNEAQYVPVNSSVGTISVKTIIDPITSPREGNEEFKVYLRDKNGFVQDSATITLNDVIESYTISGPPLSQMTEGSGPYTFTAIGTNVPYGGETTIKWHIDSAGGGTSASFSADDLEEYYDAGLTAAQGYPNGFPDSAGNAVEFAITSGSGTFTLDPRVDGVSEGPEFVVLRLTNQYDVPVGSGLFTILNTNVAYTVAVSDIQEGSNLSASITSGTYNADKTIKWQIEGAANADARFSSYKGEVTLDGSGNGTVTVPTTVDNDYQGSVAGTFKVYDSAFSPVVTGNDTFNITDADAVYTLTASPAAGQASGTTTFTIGGTNIPDGDVYFYVDNAAPNPTSDNDFNPDPPPRDGSRRTVTVSGGTATTDLTFAAGAANANDEDFIAYIYDASTGGNELAELTYKIVQGSYTIETLNTSNATITNIDEGDTLRYKFTVPDGTYYYWFDKPTEFAPDGPTIGARQSIAIVAMETVDIVVEGDNTIEGSETVTIFLSTSSTGGAVASKSITINDTSLPTYDVGSFASANTASTTEVTTRTEAQDLFVGVETLSSGSTETLYVELSGTGASQYTSTQQNGVFSSGTNTRFTFTTNGDDGTPEADRTITITVTAGDYASGSPTRTIDTVNVTLTDAAGGAVLSINAATPSPRDEGSTIRFDVSTTNVPDATNYYLRPTKVYAAELNLFDGSPIVTFSSPSTIYPQIVTGMDLYSYGGLANPSTAYLLGRVINVTSSNITLDTAVSTEGSIPVEPKYCYFVDPQIASYFDMSQITGSPLTISSGTATRTLNLSENTSELVDRNITMGLYEERDTITSVDTEAFTITNITTGNLPNITETISFDTNLTSFSSDDTDGDGNVDARARSRIRFKPNGEIDVYFFYEEVDDNDLAQVQTRGSWVDTDPGGDAGNYTVELTSRTIQILIPGSGYTNLSPSEIANVFTGDFQTPLTLDAPLYREWQFNTTANTGATINYRAILTFEIADNLGNTASTTVQFDHELVPNDLSGGGGFTSDGEFECFLAGTQITMSDGTTKNIEDIVVGDQVLGQGGVTNEVIEAEEIPAKLRQIFSINDGYLEFTPSHLLLTTEGWAAGDRDAGMRAHPDFEDIISLEPGQELVLADGTTEILYKVESNFRNVAVYNINVTDGDDTFVAGGVASTGIIVHNK